VRFLHLKGGFVDGPPNAAHTVSVMRAISPFVIFAVFDVQALKCCR